MTCYNCYFAVAMVLVCLLVFIHWSLFKAAGADFFKKKKMPVKMLHQRQEWPSKHQPWNFSLLLVSLVILSQFFFLPVSPKRLLCFLRTFLKNIQFHLVHFQINICVLHIFPSFYSHLPMLPEISSHIMRFGEVQKTKLSATKKDNCIIENRPFPHI